VSLDVLRARVAFRDRPFVDVMDLALRFVVVHGRLYAKVAATAVVPCVAVTLVVAWLWGWLAAWVAAFLLSFVAQVPFTVLASRLVFEEQVSARAVLRASAGELPRVLAIRALWITLVALASTMLVPGVWLGSVLLFVDEVMILERSRVGPAFGRSQRVASSALGQAFAAAAMMVLVPLAAAALADVGGRAFIGGLLQFREPAAAWTQGGSVLAVLGWFGVVPYVTTARFFTYLNVRTRAEGWDIQTRFAAIAARARQEETA
jgi:hypothetical protein